MLILSNEAIYVSKNIGGTFHSKVSLVTQGLGHVSTTLDPGWEGQILVPMNNPTNKSIKVVIGKKIPSEYGKYDYRTFITLLLYKSISPSTVCSDNKPNRYELLRKIVETNNYSSKKDCETLTAAITDMEKEIEIDAGKTFEQKYANISKTIDMVYNKSINKVTSNVISRRKLRFRALVFFMVASIIAFFAMGVLFTTTQWISTTVLMILLPTYTLVINHIKDELH